MKKSLIKQWVLVLFTVVLAVSLNAQYSDIIPRFGKIYREGNTITKFKFQIQNNLVEGLLNDICEQRYNDGLICYNDDLISEQSRQIAGLVFIPIWDTVEVDGEIEEFTTIGIRIVIALWKIGENCQNYSPAALEIAGFGEVMNAMDPIQPGYSSAVGLYSRELLFDTSIVNNPLFEVEIENFQGSEFDRMKRYTREFDFVFLEYQRYRDLATDTRFFPNGDRTNNGIILERSQIRYDTKLDLVETNPGTSTTAPTVPTNTSSLSVGDNPQAEFDVIYFRSLSFQPLPKPFLMNYNSTAAIAIEEGKRCPPYWIPTENNEIAVARAMQETANNFGCDESFEIDPGKTPRTPSGSIHYGRVVNLNRDNPFEETSSVTTVDIEVGVRKNISLEGLVSVFNFSNEFANREQTSFLGFNLMLKTYLLKLNKIPNFSNYPSSIYVSVGPGAHGINNVINYGLAGEAGVQLLLAKQGVYAEVGVQYLNVNLLNRKQANPIEWALAKAGVKYYFDQNR